MVDRKAVESRSFAENLVVRDDHPQAGRDITRLFFAVSVRPWTSRFTSCFFGSHAPIIIMTS